jgi:hypothetical protein
MAVAEERTERSPVAAGIRGEGVTKLVEHEGTRLYWRLGDTGLSGALVPPRSASIELHSPLVEHVARASDPDGSFAFDMSVPRPFRLAVVDEDGSWVTPWQS